MDHCSNHNLVTFQAVEHAVTVNEQLSYVCVVEFRNLPSGSRKL